MTSSRCRPSLRLASWNARGLRNKTGEVELLLDEFKIDILLVCETFLKPSNKIKIRGYNCYREDRSDRAGGGVALVIKSTIQHNQIQLPAFLNIEAVGIELKLHQKTYTIISCYNPPDKSLLNSELDTIFDIGHSVIAAGDFNAKHTLWGCKSADRQGASLLRHITLTDTVLHHTTDHTHHPTNGTQPSTLDVILTRNVALLNQPVTCNRLSSDHLPVYFTIGGRPQSLINKSFNYSKANWKMFRNIIANNLNISKPAANTIEIDKNLQKLTDVIKTAKNCSIPQLTLYSNRLCIPPYLQIMIREKNKLRKKLRTTGDNSLKRPINQLTFQIKQSITNIKNDTWSKRLAKMSPTNGSLWKMTKYLRSTNNSINTLETGGKFLNNPADKAELLANTFQNNHDITTSYHHKKTCETVTKTILDIENFTITNNYKKITTQELTDIIKSLKVNKSPGHDEIDNRLLKNLPLEAVLEIANILNDCFVHGYFPEIWKVARVIAIPKPGKDSKNPINYRPISLLSTISKLFERTIYNRLIEALDDKLRNDQHGFRRGHATTHQLTRLTEDITMGFNHRRSTAAIFLDAEKAFDTVWHDGLLHKLTLLNTPKYLIKTVKSYLSHRQFYVSIDGHNSVIKHITAGVPQGSVIGPLLYILYTNDLPVPRHCKISLYADDTACYTSGKNPEVLVKRLQKAHNALIKYYTRWKIKINSSKTEAVFFTTRRHWPLTEIITSTGDEIRWSNQVKYLGLLLDARLRWGPHTILARNKAMKAMAALYPIFNRHSNLTTRNKILIHKTIIRPTLTYGAPVWSNLSQTNMNKLQTIQNKSIKTIYNTPILTNLKKIHNTYKIPTIQEHIHKLTSSFYTKTTNIHHNETIRQLGQYDLQSLKFKYKHRLPKHIII